MLLQKAAVRDDDQSQPTRVRFVLVRPRGRHFAARRNADGIEQREMHAHGVRIEVVERHPRMQEAPLPAFLLRWRQQPGAPLATGFLGPVATELINAQLERLGQALTQDRLNDFDRIRDDWRAGRDEAALVKMREMKTRDDWRLVAEPVRAKFLRFEASLVLALESDVAKAHALADEASRLDPSESLETLNALIAYHENGSEAAMRIAASPRTLDAWNLRMALLAELNEWQQLLTESENPPRMIAPNAETRRLRALALAFLNRLGDARAEINRALAQQPTWFTVRFAAAIVDYYESLSAAIVRHVPTGWPAPIDTSFVRRDATALASLKRAEATFSDLLACTGLDAGTRQMLEGWKLASLANHIERQKEATSYCAELLKNDPKHPLALSWATARGYPIDVAAGIDALFNEVLPQSR